MDTNKLIEKLIEIEKREIPDDCGMAMFTLFSNEVSYIFVDDMGGKRAVQQFTTLRELEDFITTE